MKHTKNRFANLPLGKSGYFSELKVSLGKTPDIGEVFTCTLEHHIYCQWLAANQYCCVPTSRTQPRAMEKKTRLCS